MAIKRITTNLIKDSDIATVDIANNAITAAKITDGNITTAKLADLSVTAGKLAGTLDLTGKTITVATATTGDNDTSPASTAFVQQEIAALVDSSPSSLNTLNELAAALGDDASFSTTVTNSIATKLPLAGGTMTGDLKIVNSSGATLDINSNASAADSKILLHEGTSASPANGASIRYDGANNLFKIGVGSSVDTTRLTIARDTGNVGIGNDTPTSAKLEIKGAKTQSGGAPIGNVLIADSTSLAANTGGGITFQGVYQTGGAITGFASIEAMKETATHNEYGGALVLKTREDQGAMAERMRINSTGNVGLGTSSPKTTLNLAANNSGQGPILTLENTDTSITSNDVIGQIDFYANDGSTNGTGAKVNIKGIATSTAGTITALTFGTADSASSTATEKMRIDASGNLFIGGTSSTSKPTGLNKAIYLQSQTDNDVIGYSLYTNEGTNNRRASFFLDDANGVYGFDASAGTGVPSFVVNGNGNERMRIDSSGNVLVGTTSTGSAAGGSGTSGININANGGVELARSANPVLFVNRTTSDGDIVQLRKNGSTVGSLASISGAYLAVRSNGGNLRLGADNTDYWSIDEYRIYPTTDAVDDIGLASNRVRNLHLSGGVYLGGSGAANKLDDYEEGTWSPSISTGTATFGGATYTKVGRLVTCHFIISNFSDRSTGNIVIIGNLPFAAEDADRPVVTGVLGQYIASGFGSITGGYLDSTTAIRLYNTSSGAYTPLKHNNLTSVSSSMYVAFSYMAT